MSTLDIEGAAALLHIHPWTLYAKARKGEVPGAKIGKVWVFIEVDLLDYIRGKYKVPKPEELPKCQSINRKALPIGTSRSRTSPVTPLDDLLAQVIRSKRRNTTTG